jgi:hypothetical protein
LLLKRYAPSEKRNIPRRMKKITIDEIENGNAFTGISEACGERKKISEASAPRLIILRMRSNSGLF